jgi:ParB-like chromosome segregation protein Spo0J
MLGVTYRPPDSLKPHPLNQTIYDAERDDSDLRRSIADQGILSPLTIDQHGTILAGHRRWRVARSLALDSIPVIEREITDPLQAERILIESNRQREKTASERMHEADHLTRILAEEARRRMLGGKAIDPTPMLAEGKGETRTKVAEAIGMKRSTYTKTKKVFDAAQSEETPEPIRAVAQRQMAALDAGDTTPHAAEQAVRQAEVTEKLRALPEGAAMPDPFADRPLVKSARLVKNARQALKATADNLQYYTPEEMADAVEMTGPPDIVTDDVAELGRWVAGYLRAVRRGRSSLHVVS